MEGKKGRFMELEGLRIVAALVVVIYHALLIFYPAFFYGIGNNASGHNIRFEDNIYGSPFAGLLSGTFAVGIFFVLSGFVLTVSYFIKKDDNVIKRMAAKRYLRLMLPALASVLIVFVILAFGLNAGMDSTVEKTHSLWLSQLWNFTPSLGGVFTQATQGIFTAPIAGLGYNPVLWTIFFEFLGSFIVFVMALAFGQSRHRWVVYSVSILLLYQTWLLGFILGMILADLYVNRRSIYTLLNSRLTYVLIPVAIFFGGYPSGALITPWYQAITVSSLDQGQNVTLFVTIGSAIAVLAVLSLSRVGRFFANKHISRYGKYAYSLYLMHMPVLFTVCVGAFSFFMSGSIGLGFHVSALLSFLIAFVVLVGTVYLFEKYIDAPAIRISSVFADAFLGGRTKSKK